jgi:cysteine-rich repeat protein
MKNDTIATWIGAILVFGATGLGCGSKADEPIAFAKRALGAANDHTVLILSTTVVPDPEDPSGRSPEQILAEAAGLTVELANEASWGGKSTADFASYRAVILGDPSNPDCQTDTTPIAAAEANRAVWGPAITGNVIVAGAAPVFAELVTGRRDDASLVTDGAIRFATAQAGKTGAYISLSCYYPVGPTPVTVLEPFNSPSATFTVSPAGCFDPVHKVADHPTLAAITDIVISDWACSAREAFETFPIASFLPVAIDVTSSDPGALPFADGTTGVPYIVARGVTPVGCGNGVVDVREECDDGNTNNGDGCSAQCKFECGNGVLDVGEQCDDGNRVCGDGCSATCHIEACGNGVLDCGEQCDDGNTVDGDGCSSTCTVQNRAPVALCKNVSTTADAACHANASIDNGSFDPDGDPFTCLQNPAPPYTRGMTSVTLTCTDNKGASGTPCVGVVTVADNTKPVFTFVPPAITISVCVNANIGQATATDNCGPVTVTNNAPSKFPLGTTVVTWTARDAAGNTRTATQQVTAILGDSPSCCPNGTNVILGTSGSDNIVGTDGADCILGLGGDDVIDARGGNDFVSGGAGRDTIFGGLGDDILYGGDGDDTLDGTLGTNKCSGGAGTNTLANCQIIIP